MPKKRHQSFKLLQGPSQTPNQSSSGTSHDNNVPTVNDRLSALRQQGSRDAAATKRAMADAVNQKSVPPDLRGLLGVPETAEPKPKEGRGGGARGRWRERWRTPGPAAPRSWASSSTRNANFGGGGRLWEPTLVLRGERTGGQRGGNGLNGERADERERRRSKPLLRFAKLAGLAEGGVAGVHCKPPRLMHLALKCIAENWNDVDEADYPALIDIPLRVRLRLLSFIDYYGPGFDMTALEALLQGNESVQQLDLSGQIGHGDLTLRRLERLLEKHPNAKLKTQQIADSWEDEVVAESWEVSSVSSPSFNPALSRFATLTHLSLSHPPPTVLWRDLLHLTKRAPQLTHLSLAYWPRPTLTPNLTTTTATSTPIHNDDLFDSDRNPEFAEAISLIHQLSTHTLRLQFLDLEGCETWTPALKPSWAERVPSSAEQVRRDITPADPDDDQDAWTSSARQPLGVRPLFTTTWRNLTHLRLSQGWLPSRAGVRALMVQPPPHVRQVSLEIIRKLARHLDLEYRRGGEEQAMWVEQVAAEKRRAQAWLEKEEPIVKTMALIGLTRSRWGCARTKPDFGWGSDGEGALGVRIVQDLAG